MYLPGAETPASIPNLCWNHSFYETQVIQPDFMHLNVYVSANDNEKNRHDTQLDIYVTHVTIPTLE